ncbi:MAG: SPFH domain-containing protein [Thermodesulfobacteriota bacterium]
MDPLTILLVLTCVVLVSSARVLREHERLAIIRLGRFHRVSGPGVVFLIPAVDRGVRVDLHAQLPGWQSMSDGELEERIKQLAQGAPPADMSR